MPGHATVLNLLPASDIDVEKIRALLKVDKVDVIPGDDVRDLGAAGMLKHIREKVRENQSDTFVINSLDWSRQSRRTSLYALAMLIPVKNRYAVDSKGAIDNLTWHEFIFMEYPKSAAQMVAGKRMLARTGKMLAEGLKREPVHRVAHHGSVDHILYMRTDLWFGVKAGGSVGHIAGVIDGFEQNKVDVRVLSWGRPALVDESVEFTKILPDRFFINDRELAILAYNSRLTGWAARAVFDEPPDAIYARYALHCWAPVTIAEKLGVPLILEYNGSEVWIERNWGKGLKYPGIARDVEDWVLKNADLITVVSSPLKDELIERGYEAQRIIVNPNAVDPVRFNPENYKKDEIKKLKSELGIPEGNLVAGFIGTFSPWHGVEVLARTIPLSLEDCSRLHFVLIGDGPLFEKVKEQLRVAGVLDRVTLTGLIPQDEAAKYLMCCDFFVSPHVPNADGTPFFGSPTKLFEYMALGKGIIASNLDQLGEILTDGDTALLVPPGDVEALDLAIERLYNDPKLSDRLGKNARELVLKEYTWKAHVSRILDAVPMTISHREP